MLTVPLGKTKVKIKEDVKTNSGVSIKNLKKGDVCYIDGYMENWIVIVKLEDGDIVMINNIGYLEAIE